MRLLYYKAKLRWYKWRLECILGKIILLRQRHIELNNELGNLSSFIQNQTQNQNQHLTNQQIHSKISYLMKRIEFLSYTINILDNKVMTYRKKIDSIILKIDIRYFQIPTTNKQELEAPPPSYQFDNVSYQYYPCHQYHHSYQYEQLLF